MLLQIMGVLRNKIIIGARYSICRNDVKLQRIAIVVCLFVLLFPSAFLSPTPSSSRRYAARVWTCLHDKVACLRGDASVQSCQKSHGSCTNCYWSLYSSTCEVGQLSIMITRSRTTLLTSK